MMTLMVVYVHDISFPWWVGAEVLVAGVREE